MHSLLILNPALALALALALLALGASDLGQFDQLLDLHLLLNCLCLDVLFPAFFDLVFAQLLSLLLHAGLLSPGVLSQILLL